MGFFQKMWNKKVGGIPAFIFICVVRVWEVLASKLTTFFVCKNLNSVGMNVKIHYGFKYRYPKNIIIGNNVEIGTNVVFSSELSSGKIAIMDNVVIGRNSRIDFSGGILIQEGVLLSEGVIIQTHDHGLDPRSTPVGKSLTIKRNAWLGINSTVLSNTRIIGVNSILAANALSTKEILDNSIYGGVPAVNIKNI